ncbi:hypothetical protein ACFUTU_01500 [Arthrobacter sp. NPDC057388]|uniref:hypothetical protein n=1 Tax=Arthrobacter sp. NPDC057388 TaxID=3346116 RepID=UPI0036300855
MTHPSVRSESMAGGCIAPFLVLSTDDEGLPSTLVVDPYTVEEIAAGIFGRELTDVGVERFQLFDVQPR